MKSFRLLFAVTTLGFLFTLTVSTATAGTMGNGAAQRQRLVVELVDATAGTIEFKSMVDNSIHAYKIDAATKISIGRTKGTIDQIKVGQKVVNYSVRGGQPPQTLDIIMVYEAVPVPVSPANP